MPLSASQASLRGIHANSAQVVWASGTQGTYLLSTDSGRTWREGQVPESKDLDFRSVYAFSTADAYLLSSGPAEKSKLFHTTDGGLHWQLLYTATEGFLDGLRFWDARHGIILGDPVGDQFVILTTADAGRTWQRQTLPPALADEGGFAASNSSLVVRGRAEAWFGTSGGRVFHTKDAGKSWTVTQTPIRHDAKTAGIFSLFFTSATHGIAVGGDYAKPNETEANIAVTNDGGKTWTQPAASPTGYRSAVACAARHCIAAGPTGTDISQDGGAHWSPLNPTGYHALTVAGKTIHASGPAGRLAQLDSSR